MNKSFTITEAYRFGWITFKKDWKYWILALLLTMGLGSTNLNLPKLDTPNTCDTANSVNTTEPVVNTKDNSVLGATTEKLNTSLQQSNNADLSLYMKQLWEKYKNVAIIFIIYGAISLLLLIVLSIVGMACFTILQMGYIHLVIDAARNVDFNFKTLLSDVNVKKALTLWVLYAGYGLIVGIGFIFFIIPGIYFALKYIFAPFIYIDKNTSVMDSLKQSALLSKGVKFKLLGFFIVGSLLNLLGFLVFFVGSIVASIVTTIAFSYVYNQLQNETVSHAQPIINA